LLSPPSFLSKEGLFFGGIAAAYYLTLAEDNNADVSDFLDFVRFEDGRAAIEVNFFPFRDNPHGDPDPVSRGSKEGVSRQEEEFFLDFLRSGSYKVRITILLQPEGGGAGSGRPWRRGINRLSAKKVRDFPGHPTADGHSGPVGNRPSCFASK